MPEGQGNYKHGATAGYKPRSEWPREYRVWECMKKRLKTDPRYAGLYIDPRWEESYEAFLADMGPAPTEQHQIDRKDGTKGYYKTNCRWATRKEQANNRTSNVLVDGFTLKQWAERAGIPYGTLHSRIRGGWPFRRAVTPTVKVPLNGRYRRRIQRMLRLGATAERIAARYGISEQTVQFVGAG